MLSTAELLKQYKTLLLQMGKYLTKHTSISQTKLKEYIQKYSDIDVKNLIFVNEKINYGYKDKFKQWENKVVNNNLLQ